MSSFTSVFGDIKTKGQLTSPRGQKTLECRDYTAHFLPFERFANFPSRKLSLNYIKRELLWYLRGDRSDLSITEYAKLWKGMITDGQLNSNYGYYVFREGQVDYVVNCLLGDKDSRRALISILGKPHLYLENKDVPCTVSLGFRIRDNKLECTVHMRSCDAIYGMSNDIPFFSFVHEVVLVMLNDKASERLELGGLSLFAESLHVYERHFEMLEKLITEKVNMVDCPRIASRFEIDMLRLGAVPKEYIYKFTHWLHTKDPKVETPA